MRKAGLAPGEAARVRAKLADFGLPLAMPGDLPTDALIEAARRDKKFEGGRVRFVVCPHLGEAFVADDVTEGDIRRAIDSLRE